MTRATRYSPEVRERAIRMVLEHEHEHSSQWSAIVSIASKIGCTPETLRKDTGRREGLTSEDRARIKELERENRELRRAVRFSARQQLFSPRRSSTGDRSDDGIRR